MKRENMKVYMLIMGRVVRLFFDPKYNYGMSVVKSFPIKKTLTRDINKYCNDMKFVLTNRETLYEYEQFEWIS